MTISLHTQRAERSMPLFYMGKIRKPLCAPTAQLDAVLIRLQSRQRDHLQANPFPGAILIPICNDGGRFIGVFRFRAEGKLQRCPQIVNRLFIGKYFSCQFTFEGFHMDMVSNISSTPALSQAFHQDSLTTPKSIACLIPSAHPPHPRRVAKSSPPAPAPTQTPASRSKTPTPTSRS